MNGNYYPNPTFPQATPNYDNNTTVSTNMPMEESYIENILRLNRGKKVKLYAAFPDSNDWRDKMFSGILEQAGKDHIIIRDVEKERWYLIPMIYLNFVESEEKFNYSPEFS